MKTTLNIDETLLRRLRETAAQRKTTMSAVVEADIRHIISEPAGAGSMETLARLPKWRSGGFYVDVANREPLYGVLEHG